MEPNSEFMISEHAERRIKERSQLSPMGLLTMLRHQVFCEAHRQNGNRYIVVWSRADRRPFLVVVEKNVVVSFYYAYELQRRRDSCVILPQHIGIAKHKEFQYSHENKKAKNRLANSAKYNIVVHWSEQSDSTGTPLRKKQLITQIARDEFDTFEGDLKKFIMEFPGLIELMFKIELPKERLYTFVAIEKSRKGKIVAQFNF
jgi:hypothetical protein